MTEEETRELRVWAVETAAKIQPHDVLLLAAEMVAFVVGEAAAQEPAAPAKHGTWGKQAYELRQQGLKRREIAKRLGISAQQVGSSIAGYRARNGLPGDPSYAQNADNAAKGRAALAAKRRHANGHAPA